jgi:hypothetical protein
MAVLGTAIAIGSLVSSGWTAALAVEAATVFAMIGYYLLGGRDNDIGAIIGQRHDERQVTIHLRAAALTGGMLCLVAVIGFAIQTARGASIWPFTLFGCVGAATFLFGLAIYRNRD